LVGNVQETETKQNNKEENKMKNYERLGTRKIRRKNNNMRDMRNYEKLGTRKTSPDSVEYFYRNIRTGEAWLNSNSLWETGDHWSNLEGDCDELLLKWKEKENIQIYYKR
jgi:hypothetical protein